MKDSVVEQYAAVCQEIKDRFDRYAAET